MARPNKVNIGPAGEARRRIGLETAARKLRDAGLHAPVLIRFKGGRWARQTRHADPAGYRHMLPYDDGSMYWSEASTWPADEPRYVQVGADPIVMTWRLPTDEEMDEGFQEAAQSSRLIRFFHPLTYRHDRVHIAAKASTAPTPAARHLEGQRTAADERRSDGFCVHDGAGQLQPHTEPVGPLWLAGDRIPDDVEAICDIRGNLWMRWSPHCWWQPARDSYTYYDSGWRPPVRITSYVLRVFGPVTPVPAGWVTDDLRGILATFRPATGVERGEAAAASGRALLEAARDANEQLPAAHDYEAAARWAETATIDAHAMETGSAAAESGRALLRAARAGRPALDVQNDFVGTDLKEEGST
jgi:hypothetical protein